MANRQNIPVKIEKHFSHAAGPWLSKRRHTTDMERRRNDIARKIPHAIMRSNLTAADAKCVDMFPEVGAVSQKGGVRWPPLALRIEDAVLIAPFATKGGE